MNLLKLIFWPVARAAGFVRDKLYDFSVKTARRKQTGIKSVSTAKKLEWIFFFSIITIPLLKWIFFYVGTNGNSILMAFSSYDYDSGQSVFSGFQNFINVINNFRTDPILYNTLSRSVIAYLCTIVVTTIVPVLFSFYVYKKFRFYKFFKIVLFLPQIISSAITVTLFKFSVNRVVPGLMNDIFGIVMQSPLSNPNTIFPTVLFYYLWMNLGGGLLIQLGAMNAVDEAMIEAAKIDGANILQELWYLILPQTYQILLIGFILGFGFIFSADLGLYAFYGFTADSRTYTLGYYFTKKTMEASIFERNYFAAWGLIVSAIVIPVTFLLRKIVYKYGPTED